MQTDWRDWRSDRRDAIYRTHTRRRSLVCGKPTNHARRSDRLFGRSPWMTVVDQRGTAVRKERNAERKHVTHFMALSYNAIKLFQL